MNTLMSREKNGNTVNYVLLLQKRKHPARKFLCNAATRSLIWASCGFFFFLLFCNRRLCSSASGIKLINNDLQYKALWTECALRTEPDWRETLIPQPSLQQLLMTSMRGWRRIPSGAGPAAETLCLSHYTPGLDLYDELCWQHNVNMLCFVFF